MDRAERYDAILIGSGQATGPLSTDLVKAGRRVVLIEREHIGGTCLNEGCTPTKTMIGCAEIAYLTRRASDYGVVTGPVSVDLDVIRARKRTIVRDWVAHSQEAIEAGGAQVIFGVATFESPTIVRVRKRSGGESCLESDLMVIDTGTRPAIPAINGLDSVPYLTSTSVMELDRVPDHLVILGGGYVGVEFGQMFRRFGAAVTIVQNGPALLAREDDDVANAMADMLREDGIEVLLDAAAQSVRRDGRGVTLEFADGRRVNGSDVLVATGRRPNVEDLNPAAAGVETTDKGFIKVDDRLATTREGIYAVGDVTGGPAFTHISYDDFRILRDNLIHSAGRSTKGRQIPYVVFTDPQLARVGLSEQEAVAQGKRFRVAQVPMSHVARTVEVDRPRGFMKALVEDETDRILGCAIFGLDGGEIMAMIQIAMMADMPYPRLRDGVFSHPTLAEGLNTLFGSLER